MLSQDGPFIGRGILKREWGVVSGVSCISMKRIVGSRASNLRRPGISSVRVGSRRQIANLKEFIFQKLHHLSGRIMRTKPP